MALETRALAPKLELPPPFTLVTLREVGDAFAHAVKVAPEQGAGTLVYVGRFDLAEFAVVLEPDEPLRTARRALYTGMTALADALLAFAPPEKPIAIDWPDAIRIDGGLVGGGRLAWPKGAREDARPDWLVFGGMIRTVSMTGNDPGLHPMASALEDEGFTDVAAAELVASFARHLMVHIDASQEYGFGAVARDVSQAASGRKRRAARHRREWRPAGAAQPARPKRSAWRLRPRSASPRGSIRTAAGRAHEADPHHPARSLGYVRVRACRRARRMGGVGRVRVLERGCRQARGQGALGVSQRISGRGVARLVDTWCRSSRRVRRIARRSWNASRSNSSQTLARPMSRRRARAAEEEVAFAESLCNHPSDTLIAVHRASEDGDVREAFRTLHPRGDRKPMRAFSFLEVQGEDEGEEQPGDEVDLVALAADKNTRPR